jgi:FtsP/CotA-like multicopper oxidase with cupredoxin domain
MHQLEKLATARARVGLTAHAAESRRSARGPIAALVAAGLVAGAGAVALAHVLDFFGPPPAGDPSAFTGPMIGNSAAIDALARLPDANVGAFEGGATGTEADVFANNALANNGGSFRQFDVPTGAAPSPLFGAGEFEQQMLLFEEFGTSPLAGAPGLTTPFPLPTTGPAPEQDPNRVAASSPSGAAIEAFLDQPGIAPFPTQFANVVDQNPWRPVIESYLGRLLDTPPAEGRPPGQGWAHQRWNEFFPRVFFTTTGSGARVNGGSRDDRQRHGYASGEFAPGGLYYRVYDADGNHANGNEIVGTTRGVAVRFHPNMPIQNHKTLWTFDGTFPPKLLVGRYGEGILMRQYNATPVDVSANRGFGVHNLSTHEHNGHNPAESDGFTNAFNFPGQFYDYRWPMQLAGYDTVNTRATDPRAAFPCTPGETLFVHDDVGNGIRTCGTSGRIQIRGDWRETMSTHWFHDHMLDFTAQNVYKGSAAMFNYYSAVDRGNEVLNDGVNLRLPSGSALSWGNRDYDVNLSIADKAWDAQGQLLFNVFNLDGFLGDRVLTNFLYKPYFEVRARRYRFRILNSSVSRYFQFALVKKVQGTGGEFQGPPGSGISYNRIGFHMIANDGNLMQNAVPFDGTRDLDGDGNAAEHKGILPTQGIAERYDIVVDFASQGIVPGDRLYLVNLLEHRDGQKAGGTVPLSSILSGGYENGESGSCGWDCSDSGSWGGGGSSWGGSSGGPTFDPGVGRLLEFRVVAYSGTDPSLNPRDYEPGKKTLIPLSIDRNDPRLTSVTHRTFEFDQARSDRSPWQIATDGGQSLGMDPRRISAAPQLATGPTLAGFNGVNSAGFDQIGRLEVWLLKGSTRWSHPIHIHFEEGLILRRNGQPPPEWEKWARKDMYRIGPRPDDSTTVELAIRFREFAGTFMEHCHNTQHEDHAMLLRWDLEYPGQLKLMPAPIPTWDGVNYAGSAALPTFRTGDGGGGGGGGGWNGGGSW